MSAKQILQNFIYLMFYFRAQSRREIESVFRHFTKFNTRKTDSSQNSMQEKQTLHKIQYQKNRLFTKFNIRKTDSSQNSAPEKWILQKIQYTGIKFLPFSGNSAIF